MKSKLNKQKKVEENSSLPKQLQSAKSLPAPNNGINFTIQQKQASVKNTTGLPDNLKSGIEHLSGIDISDVKVHYNSSQPAQLNAHAYAHGNQIHVAPGQEKHLPHEAWHVVQQKQGRVKPTKQLKGKVNINDDVGLEKEADVMGAKALVHSKKTTLAKVGIQNITENTVQNFSVIVQRYLDDDGHIPANELANVDGFLNGNGLDHNWFTVADYGTITANYAALIALNGTAAASVEQHGQTALEIMYNLHLDWATANELNDTNAARWIPLVNAGAANYEANPAAGYAAAAAATWAGRGPAPATFQPAIVVAVAALVAARQAAIQAAYDAYNDGRLLPFRHVQIRQALPENANLAAVQAALAAAYTAQCIVNRGVWIQQLGIQGAENNVFGGPANGLHYTAFNDAVTTPGGFQTVENQNAAGLCAILFATVVRIGRVHATLPIGQDRHHRYWGDPPNNDPALTAGQRAQLNGKYDEMHAYLTGRVQIAINNHGRGLPAPF